MHEISSDESMLLFWSWVVVACASPGVVRVVIVVTPLSLRMSVGNLEAGYRWESVKLYLTK
jgi:hypothetical protein